MLLHILHFLQQIQLRNHCLSYYVLWNVSVFVLRFHYPIMQKTNVM
jgi:hypothetical protein